MQPMLSFCTLLFLSATFASRARCQLVQDSWTAPASPDGSTSLQSGNPFSLVWKPSLRGQFQGYCHSCDIQRLDLWVTSWNNANYNYKIAGNINITSILSYDWNVNIPTAALAAENLWVFRFTPFGSKPPFDEQISSAAVNITSSDTIFTSSTSSSSVAASTTAASLSTPTLTSATPTSTQSPVPTSATPAPDTTSKAWIAGVVIGPLAGLGLGASFMWFLSGKRKKDKRMQKGQDGAEYVQQYRQPAQQVSDKHYQHETLPSMHSRPEPAEAPDREPSELWAGNYR